VFFSRGLVNLWYGGKKKLKSLAIGQVWRPEGASAESAAAAYLAAQQGDEAVAEEVVPAARSKVKPRAPPPRRARALRRPRAPASRPCAAARAPASINRNRASPLSPEPRRNETWNSSAFAATCR
jgi:preprotein translocase subunit SecD